MNVNISPDDIRLIIENITGLSNIGVINQIEKNKLFRIDFKGGYLGCFKEENGWQIFKFDLKNNPICNWNDIPSIETDYAKQLIKTIISTCGIKTKTININFIKQFTDMENDIQRKYFNSDLGKIIIHSRPHPRGHEGVIEFLGKQKIKYIYDKNLGGIISNQMVEIKDLPF